MCTDIEKIRAWVRSKSIAERKEIAGRIDYPIDSLNKFAVGRVSDPSYTKIVALAEYMQAAVVQ